MAHLRRRNNKSSSPAVGGVKEKTIGTLLTIYSFLSFPFVAYSLTSLNTNGWHGLFATWSVVNFALFITFLIKKRVSLKIKVVFLITVIFYLFFYGMFLLGQTQYARFLLLGIMCLFGFTVLFLFFKFENACSNFYKVSENNELNYRSLFDHASEGIIICDQDGNILMVNDNFIKTTGYEQSEILGKNLKWFISPQELKVNPLRYDLLKTGITLVNERSIIAKNGEVKSLELKINALPDGNLQAFFYDMADIKRLEHEIEVERSFVKAVVDTMPGIFYLFEDHNKLVQWNESLQNLTGYSVDELYGMSPLAIFDEADSDKVINGINQAKNEGYTYFKANLKTKSGRGILLYQTAVDYHRDGKRFLVGVGYDISNLELTEAALKNSEENFKNIYNNTSDAIFIFNQNFEILSANRTFFTISGIEEEELRHVNIFEYIFDENALEKVTYEISQLESGHTFSSEYLIRNKKGRRFPVEVRSRKIMYEGQSAIVTSFNDISSRKDLEKQVYVASVGAEEEERGRIAKDLHDGLGPLLSTCKIYLHNLKQSSFNANEKKAFQKLGELINESLVGVKDISNNLSPHILRNFGFVAALNSFIGKLSAYNQINIHCNFNAPSRYNEITEITLYRVTTELLNNTLKHSGADIVTISLNEMPDKLQLIYTDNGKGFDYNETMDQKRGLGLFNINSRINSIGGIINFKSSKGHGVHIIIETNIAS